MKEFVFDTVTYYVGQNCSENDELFKIMPENAIWFHLQDGSSSHVYAISDNKDNKLSRKELKKGAELVKIYSKKSSKVIYLKKNKLKRVGPGLVELLDIPKII